VTTYRYTLALPHFTGEVEAENEDEARVAAQDDAAEQLSWNGAWWACSDVKLEPKGVGIGERTENRVSG